MQLLIRASLTHQEQRRVAAGTSGAGKRVLIIGGAGKMGAWFAHFLSSQGFAIEIADPSPAAVAFPRVADWRDSALDHDLIVVATPMKVAGDVLTRARGAAAARRRRRHRLAEEPAARRARAAGGGRLQGHVDPSDVRSRHAPLVGPARRVLRRRRARSHAGGARPVRFDDGRANRDERRRSRPAHGVRSRLVARAEPGVLHGARRERRARAAVAADVEHDVRRAAQGRDLWSRATIRICTSTFRR